MDKVMFYENKIYQQILLKTAENCPLREFADKKILLTGSTGLIGSFFVDLVYFFNLHNEKKIQLTGVNRNVEKTRIRFPYLTDKNIAFVGSGVEKFSPCDDGKFGFIIHAASPADPLSYVKNPVGTITTNVLGAINLLELSRKHGAKFLFVSTREVYGYIENSVRYKENEFGLIDFNNIRSQYPESKRVSEILCRAYADEYGVEAKIARLGYVYGPTQTEGDSRAAAQFFRNAARGEDIVLKSAGLQKRSWTFVADCVSALVYILLRGNEMVYNVADENFEVSVVEFAELVARVSGTKVVKSQQSAEERKGSSDDNNALLDATKLKRLGWKALFNLKTGIENTVKIYKAL